MRALTIKLEEDDDNGGEITVGPRADYGVELLRILDGKQHPDVLLIFEPDEAEFIGKALIDLASKQRDKLKE